MFRPPKEPHSCRSSALSLGAWFYFGGAWRRAVLYRRIQRKLRLTCNVERRCSMYYCMRISDA
ncbi:hypothetical protein BDV06DRAFT_207579 [Aspergillus oleicola]